LTQDVREIRDGQFALREKGQDPQPCLFGGGPQDAERLVERRRTKGRHGMDALSHIKISLYAISRSGKRVYRRVVTLCGPPVLRKCRDAPRSRDPEVRVFT
jgi:hypothetical protein